MTQIGSTAAVEGRRNVHFMMRQDVFYRLVAAERAQRGARRDEIILAAVKAQGEKLGEVITSYVNQKPVVLPCSSWGIGGSQRAANVWMMPDQWQELEGLASYHQVSLGRFVSAVLDRYLPSIAEDPITCSYASLLHGGKTSTSGEGVNVGNDDADDGIQTVSCRIPATLRDAILDLINTHPERPSYGQLAWWACEDNQTLVEQRTLRHLREKRSSRAQRRGRGGAGRRPAARTVSLTPRLWPEELVAIDRTHAAVQQLVADDPDLHTMKVSRTAIVIAAFEIALETSQTP